MRKLYNIGSLLIATLGLISCKRDKGSDLAAQTPPAKQSTEHQLTSQTLQQRFPVLPLIEKPLWAELLHLESIASAQDTPKPTRKKTQLKIREIANRLQQLHPFTQTNDTITLGEIRFHRQSGNIELMAKVNNLAAQQKGDQEDIEVILCTGKGRTHESLFVTEVRPLHLEILLHLAGYSKSETASQFQIFISLPARDPIPIDALIMAKYGAPLPHPLLWEFSGSSFEKLYQPDLTGDLIIAWRAHDSVIISSDPKIASNETRLSAKPHPALKSGMTIKLILAPTPNQHHTD